MRGLGSLVVPVLVLTSHCAESQPFVTPQVVYSPQQAPVTPVLIASNWTTPPTQPVDLATASRECTRLIGSINAGLAHVTTVGTQAAEQGKDSFVETSIALDSVGRAIEEQVYLTPDLLRLGGFFIGIVRTQSRVLAEVAATPDTDGARLLALQGQLATLYQQEDRVLAELNLLCRGSETPDAPGPEPTPTGSAAPPVPAPAQNP